LPLLDLPLKIKKRLLNFGLLFTDFEHKIKPIWTATFLGLASGFYQSHIDKRNPNKDIIGIDLSKKLIIVIFAPFCGKSRFNRSAIEGSDYRVGP
jgi:hypothetical protein